MDEGGPMATQERDATHAREDELDIDFSTMKEGLRNVCTVVQIITLSNRYSAMMGMPCIVCVTHACTLHMCVHVGCGGRRY